MQYGFYFNGRRCAGCKTCIMACKDFHDLPPEISFRQVYEYGGGTWRREADGTLSQDAFAYSVSVACNHCGNPACVRGYCALSCPYRAPKVDREAGHSAKCDGCTDRVAAGLEPVCVEACPLRALSFGPVGELRERYGGAADLPPLPDAAATAPNLVLTAPACYEADPERIRAEGCVLSIREIV